MRIRKNARLITSSSSSSSFLVCQLNRSPWDVDSFSLQGEVEDEFGVSRNFAQVIPSSDSLPSVESMELPFEYVEDKLPPPPPPLPPPPQIPPLEMEIEGKLNVKEDKEMGCRSNDKNSSGWKHIQPPLPPVPAPPPKKKRGRPKKSASTAASTTATTAATAVTTATPPPPTTNHSNSNPYEFYYYSGFGPSWSKRRGNKYYNTCATVDGTDISNCCNTSTINDVRDESPSSSASHAMGEDVRDDDNNNNNVIVMDRVVEGELDYIEDDFDDDDDDDENGGRRIRKPVKARSLKSLM